MGVNGDEAHKSVMGVNGIEAHKGVTGVNGIEAQGCDWCEWNRGTQGCD